MKYRVFLREVVEPYSQKEWHEDYNTIEQAYQRIVSINNLKQSPDWFVQAKEEIRGVQDNGQV